MKILIQFLLYLNLFFAGISTVIALGQIPKFFPELQIYWGLLWIIGLLLSVICWLPAQARTSISNPWLAAIATISLLVGVLSWF